MTKVLEFQHQHQSSNEYSGLIFFRIDWLDLVAIQGTLKSPLQQFKSISSLVLSFLYNPTLTSIRDYWKYQVDLLINAKGGKGELEELEGMKPVL